MIQKHFLLLFLVAARGSVVPDHDDQRKIKECRQDRRQRQDFRPWSVRFEKMDSILKEMTEVVRTPKCRSQMTMFRQSLENSSFWAVEMVDANAKIPQSVLSSDAFDSGNYDGCLGIDLKREPRDNILGRYCLAKLAISESTCQKEGAGSGEGHEPSEYSQLSMFDRLIVPLLRSGVKNKVFRLGVCFPHECTATDVETMLHYLYNNVTKINCKMIVKIPEKGCITALERHESTSGTIISRTFLAMFFGVVLITTLQVCSISHRFRLSGFINRFVLPFSAYRNYKSLIFEHSNLRLPVVDTLKVCVVLLLTFVRRFGLMLESPLLNRRYVDQVFTQEVRKSFFNIANDLVIVTFLVISGFLHHKNINRKISKLGTRSGKWKASLLQFLKLIPLYASATLFFGFEFERLGDGPLWMEKMNDSAVICKRSLLGILESVSNLSEINSRCIFESWYFGVVVLHFVIITSFIVPATMKSSTGWMTLGLLTGMYYLIMPDGSVRDLETPSRTNVEFRYLKMSLSSVFPYIIGVGSSMVYKSKEKGNGFVQKVLSSSSNVVTAILLAGILSIPFVFDSIQLTMERNRKSRQIIWSLIVSWLIVRGSTEDIAYLSPVMKHKYLTFFGSFTYPYILILGLVQNYMSGTMRTMDYFSYTRLVWMTLADVVSTYIFAFVFYMMIHRPISTMLEEAMLKVGGETKKEKVSEKKD